jgi:N-acetylated-alpha-linked acidic dipeptidase
VPDPETKLNVQRRAQLRRIGRAQKPDEREEARSADLRIGALGDGSDYAPFLDHAGIAALNIGFGGEANGGIYHSIYDDFYWYTHFGDPEFVYERALAQLGGTAVMRMADADVLPFDPSASADTVKRYLGELKSELKERQDKAKERNRELEEGVFTAIADPQKKYVPPPNEQMPPYLNFAPLENGVAAYERAAKRYKTAFSRLADSNPTVWDSPEIKAINQQLILTERTFMTTEGLKERPWFKHQIYAPGAYTGYGVKTFPAVREMIEEDKWTDADAGAVTAGGVLMKEASLVDSIAAQLEKVVGQAPSGTQAAKKRKRSNEAEVSGR